MKEHTLNNPVWAALLSGNKDLSKGTERVKFFDADISPFCALRQNASEEFLELHESHCSGQPVFLWASALLDIPGCWNVLRCIPGKQMLYAKDHTDSGTREGIVSLNAENVPAMLSLTRLTKPGPFGQRTIEFGNYEGIFHKNELVAMTGQRFHCDNFIEISAVCTHPEHLGKGYASQLLRSQVNHILSIGCTPYLHVAQENQRAIKVYENLGFETRMPVNFYVLQKNDILLLK